ncbi:hypothetical protein PGT21_035089 [Puccinia graminis f. sp. tritici]|uniref:Uncharacterized protein n=1 Tax=Puccinia graminis f. sp. tritici TaxID=56615 RepID=A0A5B0MPW8_PUCGR|nr:hypothetical protein PGT21_035089 [Puccinia graminis f. sp. tritici]
MRTLWRTALVSLPYAQDTLSAKPGPRLGDLFQVKQAESWEPNQIRSLHTSEAPLVTLDLFPSIITDVSSPDTASSTTNPLGMRAPITAQADANVGVTGPNLLDDMHDVFLVHYDSRSGSPTKDFLSGISDKRRLPASFSGELAQSRSQNQVVSQFTASRSTSDTDKDSESWLDLTLALADPETARKKQKIAPPAPAISADAMSGSIFSGKSYGHTPHSSLLLNHRGAVDKKQKITHIKPGAQVETMNSSLFPKKHVGNFFNSGTLLNPGLNLIHPGSSGEERQESTTSAVMAAVDGGISPEKDHERISRKRKSKDTVFSPQSQMTTNHDTVGFRNLADTQEKDEAIHILLDKMKTELILRDLFHSSYTEKVWAWIYGGTTYLIEPAHQELKLQRREKTSEFVREIVSMSNEIIQTSSHSTRNIITAVELHENVTQFVDLLLLTNLRLLRGLGSLTPEGYSEEHDLLHDWLLEILKNAQNQDLNLLDHRNNQIFPEITLKTVLDSVLNAFISKNSNRVIYQLVKKTNVVDTYVGVFSEKQLKMTKTVITLLASYYKLHNPEKWRKQFRDEGAFLSYLAKLQNPHMNCEVKEIGESKEFIQVLEFLPWKNPLKESGEGTSRSFALSLRPSSSTRWNTWIDPFYMGTPAIVADEVWATISLIERGDQNVIAEDANALIPALRRFERNRTNTFLSPAFWKMCDDRKISSNQIKSFSILIWVLNSALIEAFGYAAEDPAYLEEQNLLQDDMLRDYKEVSASIQDQQHSIQARDTNDRSSNQNDGVSLSEKKYCEMVEFV